MHEIIAREIREAGVISFERFMELALYCPVYGYYEKEGDNIGRAGDFFTSVSVGNVFGELLARQFADWLQAVQKRDSTNQNRTVQIVEAAAHRGRLAKDILGWIQQWRKELFAKLEYWIVEPSAHLHGKQQNALASFGEKTHWVSSLTELKKNREISGVIFSNELLDAMPVKRIGWDAGKKRWFEWGVSLQNEKFVWAKMPEVSRIRIQVSDLPDELLAVLPDGFTTEISPVAKNWWREAADILKTGKLVTLDYGCSAEELIIPERGQGTLRGYANHRVVENLLAEPGETDITAHVNFTAIQLAGESAGLKTEACISQEKFLTEIAAQTWRNPGNFPEWTPARLRQFQTLTHPEHLGRPFRVLIQSR
ncbi:MAG TPA: SAM-dependent methyltransferase [Verrucomicrobiae bacterium]|nr:SAM-dependent methyltransferase [Verrucomicrobiae bacterium]